LTLTERGTAKPPTQRPSLVERRKRNMENMLQKRTVSQSVHINKNKSINGSFRAISMGVYKSVAKFKPKKILEKGPVLNKRGSSLSKHRFSQEYSVTTRLHALRTSS